MRSCFLILGLLFCSSCIRLGPRYEAPVTEAPEDWKSSPSQTAAESVENWWDVFQDVELASLELQVLEKNPDLYVALEKVAEARAVAGVAKSVLYPQANLNPSFNNIDELIELYGVPQGLFPGLKTITRVQEQSYQLPVAMSYEVDLWGKYRGVYNAANIYSQAEDEAVRVTWLTLSTDTASHYFNLRAIDTQLDLLQEIKAIRRQMVGLIQSRYNAGLVSYLDYLQAEKLLTDIDAEYEETLRQRGIFENAIAALLGTLASEFHLSHRPLLLEPPTIPSGLPSDLLIRRPDLAEAERKMASFHEFIGVAYATYLPNILLTSTLGYSSPDLSQFLNWSGRLWQIGVNMAQIIFNVGRNSSYVKAAFARFNEAKGSYEKAVFTAFQEVEDALSNVKQYHAEWQFLESSYTSAFDFFKLSQMRYDKGIVNYLQTLEAKRAEIDAKRQWMNILGQRYQAAVQLIKALGGGWEGREQDGE